MNLPKPFTDSLGSLQPADEVSLLVEALDGESPVAVRFNPFKIPSPPEGEGVPWCRYGFYLDGRPSFTLDPLHHAGAYYVQEPSSMFVEHIVRSVFPEPAGLRMLDLCAAPGGKTTLLSTLAGLEGLVVANETVSQRASVLVQNVRRWGLGNVAVTANDPGHFKGVRGYFDLVLVDAPCSGEGMFRKDPASRAEWSEANVTMCAARQRRILAEAWGTLKPGGILVYSTCTFNRTENEGNSLWLCEEYGAEPVIVEIPAEWGVATSASPTGSGGDGSPAEWGVSASASPIGSGGDGTPADWGVAGSASPTGSGGDGSPAEWGFAASASPTGGGGDLTTYRFYPHRTRGEGFTVAVVRKPAGRVRPDIRPSRPSPIRELPGGRESKELSRWVGQPRFMRFGLIGGEAYAWYHDSFTDVVRLSGSLNVIFSGVHMGRVMNGRLRPEHSLALFHDVSAGAAPAVDVPLDVALDYLRKKDIPASLFSEGINLVTHNGYPLGWVKRIGPRINNNLPKELRIANL